MFGHITIINHIVKIYCNWCEEIFEEKWKEEWGDMKNVIEKI